MSKLINRQDAINTVAKDYRYESDRITALQNLTIISEEKIKIDAITNYSVAMLADITECAIQEAAPIYEGDKEIDLWVRLSDVEDVINKYLNQPLT